jgi:hypothetical protein
MLANALGRFVFFGASSLLASCGAADRSPPIARIEFGAVPNLVETCTKPLTSWTVSMRETGDTGTANCGQSVLFVKLYPYATYTFDLVGYSGTALCWESACVVQALPGTALPDCSAHQSDLCKL